MSYRDDREALLHRADALEREVEQLRAKSERQRAENSKLKKEAAEREEAAREEAEREVRDDDSEATPPTDGAAEVAPEASSRAPNSVSAHFAGDRAGGVQAIVVARPARLERDKSRFAIGIVGAAWTAIAFSVGVAAWMVPVSLATVLAVGWLARRSVGWNAGRDMRTRWPSLPIDVGAYRELVTTARRSVVVRIEVTFQQLSRADRERVRQKLRGTGAIGRDGTTLTITSGRLRTGRKSRDWEFDAEPIRAFCERVFGRLVAVHETNPVTSVIPRVKPR